MATDFTSSTNKLEWVKFSMPTYECLNGHSGDIRLTIFAGNVESGSGCGICFGEWLAKQFPVKLKD